MLVSDDGYSIRNCFGQAATKGGWLLLEDLDCGSSDVHSVIRPLLEWRKLSIPGRGDMIEAHKDFRIFATRRF
jgi:midasin